MAKKKKQALPVGFITILFFLSVVISFGYFFLKDRMAALPEEKTPLATFLTESRTERSDPKPTPTPSQTPIPTSKTLQNDYHIFQTFNNCGPAALSMALSYYGINISQAELGQQLRPYQVAGGDNDDKSVTLAEVAAKAEEYGLKAYRRPNGTPYLLEQLLANDMPVIVRTWLEIDDDIGHYRIIKGYNQTTQQFLQDDSLQGKNLWYNYDDFAQIWKKFNYEYVVLVPPEKITLVEQIIGEDSDAETAWKKAAAASKTQLSLAPDSIDERFNLSVALYNSGDYQSSVDEFEKIESRLPARTLWYQIEPILAYMQLREYDRVLEITERILTNNNRAFSELYILRGDIFKERGDLAAARAEYEKAVLYNQSLITARERLESL